VKQLSSEAKKEEPIDHHQLDSSGQKFKENEKNLNEDRLKDKESNFEINLVVDTRKVMRSKTSSNFAGQVGDVPNQETPSSTVEPVPTSQSTRDAGMEQDSEFKPEIKDSASHEILKKLRGLCQFIDNLDNPVQSPVPVMVNRQLQQRGMPPDLSSVHSTNFTSQSNPTSENDWMQNIVQIKMFLNSLNVQKPSPQ